MALTQVQGQMLTGGALNVGNNTLGAGNATSFKNRLINGNMAIDQRNGGASFSSSVNGAYNLDRWYNQNNSGGTRFTVQQNAGSVTPPVGFSYYLGVTSTSAYSIISQDVIAIGQKIEGYNSADLGWGTANAKTVTISFWVRSSLTGTFGGSASNNNATRFYPFVYTISSANTWEQKSVTIAGDTTGTWPATNSIGIQLLFNLGTGVDYSGTAGAWTGSPYYAPTGATSVVGTNGATWYVTGVQLEVGSSATSFDYRDYGRELMLCQRYYERFGQGGAGKAGNGNANAEMAFTFQVAKRTSPSITFVGSSTDIVITECGVAVRAIGSLAGTSSATNGAYINGQTTTNGTGGVIISFPGGLVPWLAASAEL